MKGFELVDMRKVGYDPYNSVDAYRTNADAYALVYALTYPTDNEATQEIPAG